MKDYIIWSFVHIGKEVFWKLPMDIDRLCNCPGYLGRSNADRIISICVMLLKVAKARRTRHNLLLWLKGESYRWQRFNDLPSSLIKLQNKLELVACQVFPDRNGSLPKGQAPYQHCTSLKKLINNKHSSSFCQMVARIKFYKIKTEQKSKQLMGK